IIGSRLGGNIENRRKDRFDVRAGGSLSFNDASYSLNEELDQSYINSTLFGNGSLYLGSWTLGSELTYRIFDQDVFGPGENVALWEASISKLFMGDRAEIRLVAFDLLNQNQGVRFTSSANFIQEQRTQSLGQYVMLNFVYHLGPRGMQRGGPGRDRRRR
ncbi:MAG: outer membrane beta-barrel family protein, partial [Gemmatimonadetes bacterium]|nr:outer membrane beta-barrel family protein [Gemmatimonadota bacterium]